MVALIGRTGKLRATATAAGLRGRAAVTGFGREAWYINL